MVGVVRGRREERKPAERKGFGEFYRANLNLGKVDSNSRGHALRSPHELSPKTRSAVTGKTVYPVTAERVLGESSRGLRKAWPRFDLFVPLNKTVGVPLETKKKKRR
jgi:hypothetical protein